MRLVDEPLYSLEKLNGMYVGMFYSSILAADYIGNFT